MEYQNFKWTSINVCQNLLFSYKVTNQLKIYAHINLRFETKCVVTNELASKMHFL